MIAGATSPSTVVRSTFILGVDGLSVESVEAVALRMLSKLSIASVLPELALFAIDILIRLRRSVS